MDEGRGNEGSHGEKKYDGTVLQKFRDPFFKAFL